MESRILLINFEEKQAEKLQDLNVKIDRGYLGDSKGITTEISEELQLPALEIVDFYFPHPVYEYKIVIANLHSNKTICDEFKEKSFETSKELLSEFRKFHSDLGIIIIFLGDYKYTNLMNFGTYKLNLKDVPSEDISTYFQQKETTDFNRALKQIKKNIRMPTNKYILIRDGLSKGQGWEIRTIYTNREGSILGCYYNKSTYSTEEIPSYIILPQFKDNLSVIRQLLKELARIYPKFLPDLYDPDWIESDRYYPKEVSDYDNKIADVESEMKTKIDNLVKKKEDAKKEHEGLKSILYLKGDKLKNAVIEVLEKRWNLKVTDMDDVRNNISKEDILIEEGQRKILAEIKGTNQPYPSSKFITQVWQHLHKSGLGAKAEGALIINYDIKKDPKDRNLAYTGNDKTQIEDIILIDTRVLFDLTLAVVDHGLSFEEGKKILFSKGRVSFNLGKDKK